MSAVSDSLLFVWRQCDQRARDLLANIPEDLRADQSRGLKNHPAWCLGHLSLYHAAIVSLARGEAIVEPNQAPGGDLFANGTKPSPDPAVYPSLATLRERYLAGHAAIEAAVASMSPDTPDRAPGLERWKTAFVTTGSALLYLMAWHEGNHLAEIADWKKSQGIPVKG